MRKPMIVTGSAVVGLFLLCGCTATPPTQTPAATTPRTSPPAVVTTTMTPPPTTITSTGVAPATTPSAARKTSHAKATTRPNVKDCETGSCWNAAHGLTQEDVLRQRDEWLAKHPGWCAYGETGAVGLC